MIEPYIVAGFVILLVFGMCAILVKRLYDNRTRTPSINVDQLLGTIIPKP